jgi:hypothetical protein
MVNETSLFPEGIVREILFDTAAGEVMKCVPYSSSWGCKLITTGISRSVPLDNFNFNVNEFSSTLIPWLADSKFTRLSGRAASLFLHEETKNTKQTTVKKTVIILGFIIDDL